MTFKYLCMALWLECTFQEVPVAPGVSERDRRRWYLANLRCGA